MKILAIRLKNLASLAGEQEIDFTREPLSSAAEHSDNKPMRSDHERHRIAGP